MSLKISRREYLNKLKGWTVQVVQQFLLPYSWNANESYLLTTHLCPSNSLSCWAEMCCLNKHKALCGPPAGSPRLQEALKEHIGLWNVRWVKGRSLGSFLGLSRLTAWKRLPRECLHHRNQQTLQPMLLFPPMHPQSPSLSIGQRTAAHRSP